VQLIKKQNGITLIELMIAMAIGLIVTAAVIALFISVLSANTTNLNEIRLNQELRAVMSLMTRDVRRAGYNGTSATNTAVNPFSSEAGAVSDTVLTISGDTINFAYDADGDGVLGNGTNLDNDDEVFGYRLTANTVQYCQGDATFANCASNWQALTDPSVVGITGLSFIDTIVTENAGTTAEVDVRQITIALSGQWVKDTTFTRTITETIKLRNEHFADW
jgi:prepilin peptidase dependent protein B